MIPTEPASLNDPQSSPVSGSLVEAIQRIGLVGISAEKQETIERYCRLLWEWNSKINLTRHTDYDTFARRDLVDSWELSKLLDQGESVLDFGTGGGVPGIVLAILRPDLHVSLCDSVGKKAMASQSMVKELGLGLRVYACPAKEVIGDHTFDSLVCRAVGPLSKICFWFRDRWPLFGRLLAIKGPRWVEERGEARHRGLMRGLELRKVASYEMPFTQSQSVILQLRRQAAGCADVDETE